MPLNIIKGSADGVWFDLSGRREYKGLHTQLAGEHQAYNAALGIAMAEDLETYGLVITEDAVRRGITGVRWPARFEIFSGKPTLVVDAAHTPESAAACARTFAKVFPGRKAVLLVGISMDKDVAGVCRELMPTALCVVATRANNPRAFTFSGEDLKRFFPSIEAKALPDVVSAKAEALRLAGKDGIILAAGSIFLAADARVILRP
jgi:dihydrofolate synthase/folylpolyglutamate synthase